MCVVVNLSLHPHFGGSDACGGYLTDSKVN